jgi:hypothetical protein
VVLFDPRELTKPYGKVFLDALPDAKRFVDGEEVPSDEQGIRKHTRGSEWRLRRRSVKFGERFVRLLPEPSELPEQSEVVQQHGERAVLLPVGDRLFRSRSNDSPKLWLTLDGNPSV